jgi:hypothetical protein
MRDSPQLMMKCLRSIADCVSPNALDQDQYEIFSGDSRHPKDGALMLGKPDPSRLTSVALERVTSSQQGRTG